MEHQVTWPKPGVNKKEPQIAALVEIAVLHFQVEFENEKWKIFLEGNRNKLSAH